MENKREKSYILISPVKNEEKYLPTLIQSIINQTIKPVLWVIVDDGSIDRTPIIITEAKEENDWIQSIRLEMSIRDRKVHLASVIKTGIEFAYNFYKENGLDFDYIGFADADVVFDEMYFEKLMEKLKNDMKLGVASGTEWMVKGENITYFKLRDPSGGDALYRRKCYEECGGIPLTELWDSVLNTKAKLRGWRLNRFDDTKVYIMRGYCHVDGLWKGYRKFGESSYVMSYNLFYAIAKGLKLSFIKPIFGFAYLYGYFNSLLLRKEQINDIEVKYYYKYMRPKEINQHYLNRLKNKIKIDNR